MEREKMQHMYTIGTIVEGLVAEKTIREEKESFEYLDWALEFVEEYLKKHTWASLYEMRIAATDALVEQFGIVEE